MIENDIKIGNLYKVKTSFFAYNASSNKNIFLAKHFTIDEGLFVMLIRDPHWTTSKEGMLSACKLTFLSGERKCYTVAYGKDKNEIIKMINNFLETI